MLRGIAFLAVLICAAWLAFSWAFVVSGSGRYRLDVEVELDGVRYSGSTVWEVSIYSMQIFNVAPGIPGLKAYGEAIDIPLPDGRTLFILRRGARSISNPDYGSSYLGCMPGKDWKEKARNLQNFVGSCDLSLSPKIIIVDENDSIEEIKYMNGGAESQGFSIISAVATSTYDPVSRGILDRYQWIDDVPSYYNRFGIYPLLKEDFSRL